MRLTESDNAFIIENVPYMSARDIAEHIGNVTCSVQSRISLLQDKGVIPHHSRAEKRDNRISRAVGMPIKDALIHLHYTLELPLKTMGEHVDETRTSITSAMEFHGIKWRTLSEDNVRRFKDMSLELRRAQTMKANQVLRDSDYKPRPAASGENNHQWKGGSADWKGSGWYGSRYLAMCRDDNKCQSCGITLVDCKLQYNEGLHVHHKIPWKFTHDNSVDNLITLCRGCHDAHESTWFDIDEMI